MAGHTGKGLITKGLPMGGLIVRGIIERNLIVKGNTKRSHSTMSLVTATVMRSWKI